MKPGTTETGERIRWSGVREMKPGTTKSSGLICGASSGK